MFGSGHSPLAYKRTSLLPLHGYSKYCASSIPSLQGHAVVADLKVLSWSETAPHDYFNIATTHDDGRCSAYFSSA